MRKSSARQPEYRVEYVTELTVQSNLVLPGHHVIASQNRHYVHALR